MNNGSGQVVAYLLGHPYVLSLAKPEFLSLVPQTIETGALKQHFSQLFWMSYRKDFQPLNYTSLVTDRGWGCMHRSSQMMMAETIRRISMSQNIFSEQLVLSYFLDYFTSPFSLHCISDEGASLGTPVGQWFSPHVAALALSRISESENDPLIPTVVVCHDTTLVSSNAYRQTVNNLCRLRTEPHTGRTIERGHRIKSSKRGATSRVMFVKNSKVRMTLPEIPAYTKTALVPKIGRLSSPSAHFLLKQPPTPPSSVSVGASFPEPRLITSSNSFTFGSDSTHSLPTPPASLTSSPFSPSPTSTTGTLQPPSQTRKRHQLLLSPTHVGSPSDPHFLRYFTQTAHETSGDNAKHPQMSSLANSSSDELSSFESDGIAPQTPPLTPCDAVEPDMVGIHDYNTLIEEQKNEPDPTVDSVDHQTLNDLKQNEFPVPRPRRRKRNVVVSLSEMPIIPPRPKQIQLLEQSDIKLRTRSFVSPTRNLHYSTPHRDSPFPKQRRKSAACASHQTRLKLLNPSPQSAFHPLLVLAPLRLGLQKINLDYLPAIQAVLSHPNSVGIVGGKPRLSFWFVGYERDNLYYLDPHTTQPAFSLRQLQEFTHHKNPKPLDTSSYHPRQIQKIPFSDLDPSMLLGFLCLSHVEFQSLCSFLSSLSPPLLSVIPKAY